MVLKKKSGTEKGPHLWPKRLPIEILWFPPPKRLEKTNWPHANSIITKIYLHSCLINPIFQYIFDYLGKRSMRSISKIVAFGAEKIKTTSDYLVRILVRWHHMAIFLRKWEKSRCWGQWRALPCHARRIFVSKNWRGWYGRHLVSTGRGHLPHSQRNHRSFVHRFRKSNNQPKFWCQLATSKLWLDPVGLFVVGSR